MPEEFSLDTLFGGKAGAAEFMARFGLFHQVAGNLNITDWTTAGLFFYITPVACRLVSWNVAGTNNLAADAADYGRIRLRYSDASVTVADQTGQTTAWNSIAGGSLSSELSPSSRRIIPANTVLQCQKLTGAGTPGALAATAIRLSFQAV